MKSLQCLRVWNDWIFFFSRALSVSCPYCLKLSFFQLQTGERWHERRESFWKLQERGTSPLCLTWSENVCAAVYCQKHTDVEGSTLHPEQILPHLCCFCVFYFYQLKEREAPDIHCRDSLGNTPLHCAAYRGQKQCIVKLLKSGANPCIQNNTGTSPTI